MVKRIDDGKTFEKVKNKINELVGSNFVVDLDYETYMFHYEEAQKKSILKEIIKIQDKITSTEIVEKDWYPIAYIYEISTPKLKVFYKEEVFPVLKTIISKEDILKYKTIRPFLETVLAFSEEKRKATKTDDETSVFLSSI